MLSLSKSHGGNVDYFKVGLTYNKDSFLLSGKHESKSVEREMFCSNSDREITKCNVPTLVGKNYPGSYFKPNLAKRGR